MSSRYESLGESFEEARYHGRPFCCPSRRLCGPSLRQCSHCYGHGNLDCHTIRSTYEDSCSQSNAYSVHDHRVSEDQR